MKLQWKRRYWLWVVVVLLAIAASVGPLMSDVEIAPYEVIKTDGAFEIRHYPDLLVAEVSSNGEREEAINAGFRPLADFIFGANEPAESIAMTAPVTQQKQTNEQAKEQARDGQPIAMTAPVLQQSTELGDAWQVRFVMPRKHTLSDMPKPKNSQVKLIEVPARYVVAIRFAGSIRDTHVMKQLETLKAYVAKEKLVVSGEPTFAFYNPPWTLPFLRRNEIWWELAKPAPADGDENADEAETGDAGDAGAD